VLHRQRSRHEHSLQPASVYARKEHVPAVELTAAFNPQQSQLLVPLRMQHIHGAKQHTLPALVWPPITSSLLSCRGVTDQPAAAGGPDTLSSGLPSWPEGWAASASAGLGAVQASLLRLYIQMSAR
jgi:hypothetical protein